MLALAALAPPARAQLSEDAVKAAFLPRFARYVAWPEAVRPQAQAPFHLCVIGQDPFRRLLEEAAGRELIDGHRVSVRRMANAEGAAGCHLAYVQGATPAETARLLVALRRQPVLTITDSRAGTPRGMIHFAVIERRVRFYIDEAAADALGISISSRLLALAVQVRQRPA